MGFVNISAKFFQWVSLTFRPDFPMGFVNISPKFCLRRMSTDWLGCWRFRPKINVSVRHAWTDFRRSLDRQLRPESRQSPSTRKFEFLPVFQTRFFCSKMIEQTYKAKSRSFGRNRCTLETFSKCTPHVRRKLLGQISRKLKVLAYTSLTCILYIRIWRTSPTMVFRPKKGHLVFRL